MNSLETKVLQAFLEGAGLSDDQVPDTATIDDLGASSMDLLEGVFEVEVLTGVNLLKSDEDIAIQRTDTLARAVQVLVARIEEEKPDIREAGGL